MVSTTFQSDCAPASTGSPICAWSFPTKGFHWKTSSGNCCWRHTSAHVDFVLRDETLVAQRIHLAGPIFEMEGCGTLSFSGRVDVFGAFYFHEEILEFLIEPYVRIAAEENEKAGRVVLGPLQTITVTDGFFAAMKASFLVGLSVAGPYVLYQAWQFIAAGLYANERRKVLYYLPPSILLFGLGTVFGSF